MNPGTFHVNEPQIVAAVDGSDHSYAVVAWAIEEAQSRGACLRVVICQPTIAEVHVFGAGPSAHGIDPVDLAVVRDQAVGIVDDVRLRGEADPRGLDIDVRAHTGPPVEHLLALSEHAALLVVGSRGSGSRSHDVIGSVATAVTRHAKGPGRRDPVTTRVDTVRRSAQRAIHSGSVADLRKRVHLHQPHPGRL